MPARMLFAECTGSVAILASLTAFAPQAQATGPRPEVVYGEDNRMDLFDSHVPDSWRKLARSTAVLMRSSDLTPDSTPESTISGQMNVHSENYGEAMALCPDERFREQPSAGFCSGFLVGPDILVTAGHCMDSQTRCETTSFVFDFGYLSANDDLSSVPESNVFRCKAIIAQELDRETKSDFAIVKLDRPVQGREPLKYRASGDTKRGTNLLVIGHPSGLPTKVAADAQVRSSDTSDPFFVANLDTFGGNSGSAVFNADSGEVEGILVRGEMDFRFVDGCNKSNHCEKDGCRGEDVTRATVFAEYMEDDSRATETRSFKLDNLNVAIPDNDPAGISQVINVDKSGEIASIGLRVKIEHGFPNDARVSLRHPDGTLVDLGSMGGMDTTKPAGNTTVRPPVMAERTFGLDGVAVKALRSLRNRPGLGAWTVVVKDPVATDDGVLKELELTLKTYAQN